MLRLGIPGWLDINIIMVISIPFLYLFVFFVAVVVVSISLEGNCETISKLYNAHLRRFSLLQALPAPSEREKTPLSKAGAALKGGGKDSLCIKTEGKLACEAPNRCQTPIRSCRVRWQTSLRISSSSHNSSHNRDKTTRRQETR